jgi:hypothetical protein
MRPNARKHRGVVVINLAAELYPHPLKQMLAADTRCALPHLFQNLNVVPAPCPLIVFMPS